jgi:hypothetical protein
MMGIKINKKWERSERVKRRRIKTNNKWEKRRRVREEENKNK